MQILTNDSIFEIAENIFFEIVIELNLENKCFDNFDGSSINTNYGTSLYYAIESALSESLNIQIEA
jgi:hypothetical protein